MSNLKEELSRMAAEGANRARPLAIAEVMRKGNRRRARTIGQRSIGGLSVLGISAAVIVGGAFHPLHGAAGHPASGTAPGVTTLTETSATSAGTLTVQVKYRNAPDREVKVLHVAYTGTPTFSMRRAMIRVVFGLGFPDISGLPVSMCGHVGGSPNGIVTALHKGHKFSGTFSVDFNIRMGHNILCGNGGVTVSVTTLGNPNFHIFMAEALVLSRSSS